ncbi:hypothetical protein N7468_010335 [Penicillium chermesinum]|uniref:DNA replication ATP-dependent helicase/nuclease n=1 Tax=Penicillium chermesinum TaxID=63820 RepID=A0A9W9NCH4_9EURO|nr:uncharacterized protein N7468_010335 [Penicillium chermesinum]KAJ5217327.1 hypothetical protein N7468_010335 [Penicillium chermesinum]
MSTNDQPPISSNSRNKLNAFRFQKQTSDDRSAKNESKKPHGNKENQSSWLNGVVDPMHTSPDKEDASEALRNVTQEAVSQGPQEAKSIKECPKTPGNRIPLADLISNAEDSFNPAPGPEVTPQEPLDLQSIQALFKTPQHDIAAELWNNYMDKNMMESSEELPPPRLANLLSSSPQTPGSGRTSRNSSAMRRSISCAAEWPTSRAKRRRVNRQAPDSGRGLFSRANSNVLDSGNSGKGKSSRINFLIEKIEKSLHPPRPADVVPPRSSPLRQRIDAERCRSSSPTMDRKGLGGSDAAQASVHATNREGLGRAQLPVLPESSSEFGDDDLDQDLMDLADAAADQFITPAPAPLSADEFGSLGPSSWSKIAAEKPQSSFGKPPTIDQKLPIVNKITNNETNVDASDEFDDEFGDFGENFDAILAECDKKQSTQGQLAVKTELAPIAPPAGDASSRAVLNQDAQAEAAFSEDEFDDDFDLDEIEQTMKQTGADRAYNLQNRQAIKRYSIVNFAEGTYVCPRGRTQPEQVLSVEDERTGARKVILLRESWFDTPCSKGSSVHLVGDFDASGQCVIDNTSNMIILHPDHLISATVVADSIDCQRRAVLQDRIKTFSQLEQPQLFGTLFHEVFQEALKANKWDLVSLRSLVEGVLVHHIEDLYAINMSEKEAAETIMSKVPTVQAWAEIFLHGKPQADSLVEDRHGAKLNLSISRLLEVEEHIWSPMYGLKGNIDATVQVTCQEDDGQKNLVIPLELKTGKRDTNHSHRAQTALYTLLLSDRYDVDVTFGLLYYLETSRTLSIRGIRHELLQMIQVRNRLSVYVRERAQLPPMLKKPRMCTRCYAKTPCLIYHRLMEDGNGETSGLGDDFEADTNHLTEKDREFFQKWDSLLTKEEGNLIKFRRELWTLLSSERESLGRCFGDVVIDPQTKFEDHKGAKINRYRYTFCKKQANPNFSFADSQIVVGEPVVISDEKGHFALANGYVLHASGKSKGNELAEIEDPYEQVTYRIDKDEFSNGMANIRNNLVCMMDKDLFQAKHLRRLIIQNEAPVFKQPSSACTMADQASLNVDQRQAVKKVMSARDYALVLGMPGTGKTTTIAHLIRALVAQGKSVLLTSYTHTAVDNILLKIRDDNIRILRLGAASKVHPEVEKFADLAAIPKRTVEELKDSYEKSQVVASTCLGINHQIFNQRIFDYCIVDEASQITLPVCVGPIRMARTFILVGDHFQLPPLVQNKEAQEGGLDISLFKLLSDTQPDSVVNLEHQYRMCEDVMLLSNELIYSGRLKCGTPEVAARSLDIPNISALEQFHSSDTCSSWASHNGAMCPGMGYGKCWLNDLLAPAAKTRLVNTDPLGTAALEVAQGQRIVNPMEVSLCSQLVESFIACGIPARNIGVITFYRSQLSQLRQSLRRYAPDLEMHTTDKFQGRDKEIVILSCVRSNAESHVGELLKDWRRVNVAFTRARTKLLVLGSRSTLRDGNDLLKKYVRLMEGKDWVYNLPPSAAENHVFHSTILDSSQIPISPSAAKALKSPGSKKSPPIKPEGQVRLPLSPLGSEGNRLGLRKPAKKGLKVHDNKIPTNSPITRDLINEMKG